MYIYIKIIYVYYIYIYIYIYIICYISIFIYIYLYIHIQHSIHLCPDSVLYFLSYSWYFFSPTCISSIVPRLLSFNFYIFTQNLGRNMTYEKMYMYSDVSYLARSNSPGQTGWLSIKNVIQMLNICKGWSGPIYIHGWAYKNYYETTKSTVQDR